MKKRWLFLIIIGLTLIAFNIFVVRLTNKNSTLGYLSDDSRQIELLKSLSSDILQSKIENKNIKIEFDKEFFLNFVNNTAYVTSQKEALSSSILEHSNGDNEATIYTISSSFNPKKLILTIKFSEQINKDSSTSYEITYKLSKGKNNTIKFKEKKFEKSEKIS